MLVGWLVGLLVALALLGVASLTWSSSPSVWGSLPLGRDHSKLILAVVFIYSDTFAEQDDSVGFAFICSDDFRSFAAFIFSDVNFSLSCAISDVWHFKMIHFSCFHVQHCFQIVVCRIQLYMSSMSTLCIFSWNFPH